MGKQTWVVSDTHFSHKLLATLRGFASPEEMDEVLIQNWNSLVKPHDRVYHLGDFCINRAAIKIAALLFIIFAALEILALLNLEAVISSI